MSLVLTFLDSCEGLEPRAIAFERHESGILRTTHFTQKVHLMTQVTVGSKFINQVGYRQYVNALVEPAANTTGIVIRTVSACGGRLYADTVKPPLSHRMDSYPAIFAASSGSNFDTLPYELVVPAGLGIFWAPANDNSSVWMTYDNL